MKILKDGKIIDIWIGQCESCKAVMEACKDDLKLESIPNETVQSKSVELYIHKCMFCKDATVLFHKVDTKEAKAILRKSNLKPLYILNKG